MNKQISKITLIAVPKTLTVLMHSIINSTEFIMFKLKVLANYEQTEIIITAKQDFHIEKENWGKILNYINDNTDGLAFSITIDYV